MNPEKASFVTSLLNKDEISLRLEGYSYLEISDIRNFIKGAKKKEIDDCGYIYIRCKVGQCLINHDDKTNLFSPLRELASELDVMISITLKKLFF